MPIIRIGDNQKNKWKRNAQNNKKRSKGRKKYGETVTMWELKDSVVHLS